MPPDLAMMTTHILLTMSVLLLVCSALHDIATRTVPNWIPATLAVAGLGLRVVHGGLPMGLLAALIVFFGAAFCWRRGWMGGADVKLIAAVSLIVPPGLVASMVLAVSLAGGLLVLVYLFLRMFVRRPVPGRPSAFLARIWRVERWRICRLESLPYASAIAAGALFILTKV